MHIEKTEHNAFCGEQILPGDAKLVPPIAAVPSDVCGRCLTELAKQGRAETRKKLAARGF